MATAAEMISEDTAALGGPRSPEREGMIKPDDVAWFPAERFEGYLWGFDDCVYISLIFSRHPGQGHLSDLFNAILADGRAVVVPTPFQHMQEILQAKGFEHSFNGECETWTKQPPHPVTGPGKE